MQTREILLHENMNKQQREYTVKRIRQILEDKIIRVEVDVPTLTASIRESIVLGTAKLRKPSEILGDAFSKIVDGKDDYRGNITFGMKDLFVVPDDHKKALAAAKADQAKHVKTNERTRAFANRLIDRVGLGEFENGMDAITEMEAYNPE